MINTRTCRRRLVSYKSLADISRDLDVLEAAHARGTLKPLGNHPPGAVLAHLAYAMRCSFDGFTARAPAWLRWLGPMFKKRILSKPFEPGFKVKKEIESTIWDNAVSFEDGLMQLRAQIARASAPGSRPTAPHPFFGMLTAEEWQVYYLRHAELHLSFLQTS
ncbi:MAG: DUF1569 domain-containing protein [Phycisphaerales bacterium]|nr:DUF1569 domain-containing protein [Phycisphaerales bacterium]